MTNANYQRHLKILGKLAYLFDAASSDVADMGALLAAFVDQYADATLSSLDAIRIFPNYTPRWQSAINVGPTALQALAKDAANAYLTDAAFIDTLGAEPASTTALAVLTQFAADTVTDSKTLTTKASTGIVNFLDEVAGDDLGWNTAADESATYKDSVYCVASVVS
jgi:hypothetical protein